MLTKEFLDSLMDDRWSDECGAFGPGRSFATDGHGFLIVDGVFSDKRLPQLEGSIKKILADRHDSKSQTIPFADLSAWLPEDGPFATCETCEGGQKNRFACDDCHGSGRESCRHCGHDSECSTCGGAKWSSVCPGCGGEGKTRRKRAPAWLTDTVLLDRRLVQRFFAQLHPDTVTVSWSGDTDPVFFEATGWVMGLMPMRHDQDGTETGRALFK